MSEKVAGSALISAQGVEKRFGPVAALQDLEFTLQAGEIHALLGGNGAGKSTFIKILAGIHDADAGTITLNGQPLESSDRTMLSFIHQDAGLVGSMTVAENFGLVAGYPRRLGLIDERELRRRTAAALSDLGVEIPPDAVVSNLSVAERSMAAIARAVSMSARVLVLDEPTANLPVDDVERLWRVVRVLAGRGVGIIYVTHRLSEVFDLCDSVTVLRDGRTCAQTVTSSLSQAELSELVAGRHTEPLGIQRTAPSGGTAVLAVRDLTVDAVSDVSFTIGAGEILALTGLRGAGQDQIASRLFGLASGPGQVEVEGVPVELRSPAAALAAGIGYISGDRSETIARTLSVAENILLNPRFTTVDTWFTRGRAERAAVRSAIERFDIRPAREGVPAGSLSGGNAQKLVMARTQQAAPKVLILHEPTAGVDVGARRDFYQFVRERCDEGMAVLLVSSDYEEVHMLAHRVLVIIDGRLARQIDGDSLDEAAIARAAMGVTA